MLLIRPIRESDYLALLTIAKESGHGFTSLPVDETLLKNKIARSIASFHKAVEQPGDEGYLMVLEDVRSGEVVGTCALEAAVGSQDAFYHYRLGTDVHVSDKLGIRREVQTLTLCNDYTGASELCTLFLRNEWRRDNIGRVLSRSRFLMLAAFPDRFGDTVIAEMRGVSDEQGNSPFWQWLEEHFFGIDFPTADYLTGIGDKVFVAELMPRNPIYVNLLSPEAQAVVGQVHNNTRPALALLEAEGFRCRGYVDIFDAGPTVECARDQIRSVQASQQLSVVVEEIIEGDEYIICNGRMPDYRALRTLVQVDEDRGEIRMTAAAAKALMVEAGASVWTLPL
ncbi:arginine N-succinyltransferase [Ferrimonas balearica]|uniref:arginine N-succinyltransferase n=1 Tax=Ferrimonas balearica TaxID=44012 RepID=UPI001C55AA89|nr:arginine N-succinyltransferase [Ferrimonas balearica]MBY6019062.1 arginine N-succinyltransferase [Halomonas denitrificans]MBW3141035.1 arginine N-succinyltransferase [Ferrimonas balearica]MBW3165765.1 arginine N-succinyltransferase [Ferrimonas balearica]MBY6095664.1 arginine N-succinyltransferase [Ferrimonas balearica]MBY6107941.1 arginine N-succinyltransferase [Ferrimonas balearica]